MKILSGDFVKKFNGKILNIHPSLLPKYKGLNTHKRVLINKENFSGCTVHIVNSKLDSGKIIMQKRVRVSKKDDPKSLSEKILKQDFNVKGFNIGTNVGKSAGQSIMHCHIHIIPRRVGDVENPQGGVRSVIPNKQHYKRKL